MPGRGDQNAVDPPAPDGADLQPVPGDLDLVAHRGNMAQERDDQTADGVIRPRWEFHSDALPEVAKTGQPVQFDQARFGGVRGRRNDVVLVVDVADQHLHQVLQGHGARDAAVLVDHHGHVRAGRLHLRQRGSRSFVAGKTVIPRTISPTVTG